MWHKNTTVLRVYTFYIPIFCTWQSIWCLIVSSQIFCILYFTFFFYSPSAYPQQNSLGSGSCCYCCHYSGYCCCYSGCCCCLTLHWNTNDSLKVCNIQILIFIKKNGNYKNPQNLQKTRPPESCMESMSPSVYTISICF